MSPDDLFVPVYLPGIGRRMMSNLAYRVLCQGLSERHQPRIAKNYKQERKHEYWDKQWHKEVRIQRI